MKIRTLRGLANLADLQSTLGPDWFKFSARFPRCTDSADAESPEFAVPCRCVYEWFGLKDYRVEYVQGSIVLEKNPVEKYEDGPEINAW